MLLRFSFVCGWYEDEKLETMTHSSKGAVALTGTVQFLKFLSIALWLGGFAFFGAVAAPSLFRVARAEKVAEVAPQMVGMMLGRFTFITYVCAALLLMAWLYLWFVNRYKGSNMLLQGLLTLVALGTALYLGQVLLPATVAAQKQFLPVFAKAERGETLTPQEQEQRAQFDVGHKLYNRLGGVTVYALLGLLGLSVAQNVALSEVVLRQRGNP